MAAKLCVFFALYFVSKVSSAPTESVKKDICACESMSDKELDQLWDYLKETEDKQKDIPTHPGLLSPAVPCSNCIEYNRIKRKTENSEEDVPKVPHIQVVDDEVTENSESDEDYSNFYTYLQRREKENTDRSCPKGTFRQAGYCVPLNYEYEIVD